MGAADRGPGRAAEERDGRHYLIRRISEFGHPLLGRGLVVFPYPSWLARIDPMRRREFITVLGGASRVAARGARAGRRSRATDCRLIQPGRRRSSNESPLRGVSPRAREAGMVAGSKHSHRRAIWRDDPGANSGSRKGAACAATRGNSRECTSRCRRCAARCRHRPNRLRRRLRSRRRGIYQEPCAAGRQSHGPLELRGEYHRQMDGDAQGDRPKPYARRSHGKPAHHRL